MTPVNDWALAPGSFDVRASCPTHPEAKVSRHFLIARCDECAHAIDICLSRCGSKECVLAARHGGQYHTSRSGSSWPVGWRPADAPSPPDVPTLEARLVETALEFTRVNSDAHRNARLGVLVHDASMVRLARRQP